MKRIVCISLFIGMLATLKAQDPAFSQFYACPLYMNPALAGTTECGRLGLNYRLQFPGFDAFNNFAVTYDQNLENINSGFGAQVTAFVPNKISQYYNVNLFYSYQIRISKKFYMRAGLAGGLKLHDFRTAEIVLPDNTPGEGENLVDNLYYAPDFSIGIYGTYDEKYYFGFSAAHFTSTFGIEGTNIEHFDNSFPIKLTAHGGADIAVGHRSGYSISPNFIYQYQAGFNNFCIGVYGNMKMITTGLWYKTNVKFVSPDVNSHGICALVGISFDKINVGYSYDCYLSGVGLKSLGAHEVSLQWNFCVYTGTQKRVIKAIKSPRF